MKKQTKYESLLGMELIILHVPVNVLYLQNNQNNFMKLCILANSSQSPTSLHTNLTQNYFKLGLM